VRLFSYLFAFLAAIPLGVAAGPPFEFPFEFRDGLLWVKVIASETRTPLSFLVDSGAQVSVLNLRAAREMKLKQGRRVAVRGVRTSTAGYWPLPLSAKIGDLPLPRKCLGLDLEKLGAACQRPVDGLLGADFFRDRVVKINFDSQTIRVLEMAEPSEGRNVVPLDVRRCGMRVPIRVNGAEPKWVRLDTGCASALQWVTGDVRAGACSRRVAVGLAEVATPISLTAVQIGATEFKAVPTGLHDEAIFAGESGLLGNGLLSCFAAVTIDAKEGQVVLVERGTVD